MSIDKIPFHKPFIDDNEIQEVVDTLKNGWLTTGPKTKLFEEKFREYVGAEYGLAANSWTAAAHLALEAMGLKDGDEVIVPALTFTACAEIVCYFKAIPIIVDIDEKTKNISVEEIKKHITPKTKVIMAVHFGGEPCEMDEILEIAKINNLKVLEDAAHAFPAKYKGRMIGTLGDATCFSFYATKTLATGEGGMLCTNNPDIAKRALVMRLHGIDKDPWNRYSFEGDWYYEVIAPGYKYNITDIQSSLGLHQLKKADTMRLMRLSIAERYTNAFSAHHELILPYNSPENESAHHLYSLRVDESKLTISRAEFIKLLKEQGVLTSVHFIPLYRHPYYRDTFNLDAADFPASEKVFSQIISLPIWPGMTEEQVDKVINSVISILTANRKLNG